MAAATEHRDRLERENPDYRRLAVKHQEYDDRLQELQARKFLSRQEQLEEVKLKKMKLAVKDQMEEILRRSVH